MIPIKNEGADMPTMLENDGRSVDPGIFFNGRYYAQAEFL